MENIKKQASILASAFCVLVIITLAAPAAWAEDSILYVPGSITGNAEAYAADGSEIVVLGDIDTSGTITYKKVDSHIAIKVFIAPVKGGKDAFIFFAKPRIRDAGWYVSAKSLKGLTSDPTSGAEFAVKPTAQVVNLSDENSITGRSYKKTGYKISVANSDWQVVYDLQSLVALCKVGGKITTANASAAAKFLLRQP